MNFFAFFQEVRKSLLVSDVWTKSDESPVTVADYGYPSFDPFLAISQSPFCAKCFDLGFKCVIIVTQKYESSWLLFLDFHIS